MERSTLPHARWHSEAGSAAALSCICLVLLVCFSPLARAQARTAAIRATNPQQRPEGLIHLDVTVTNPSGQPVLGLERSAFTLLDNGQPETVVSFAPHPEDPVTVILLLDTLQMDKDDVADERRAVEQFLRRKGGHLDEPVGIYVLEDLGFGSLSQPSRDGNALAAAVAHNKLQALQLRPPASPITFSLTPGLIPNYLIEPPVTGLQALAVIAAALRQIPGRKVLLWAGPGLGAGTGTAMLPDPRWLSRFETRTADGNMITGQRDLFDKIEWLSLLLREARIALYTLSYQQKIDPRPATLAGLAWRDFLNGVPSAQQARPMNLYKDVLAIQSGGEALAADRLADELAACIEAGRHFYTLTFNPPTAGHPNEYHSLEVRLGDPGLTAHTNTGYYDQPWYADLPPPGSQDFTVDQLRQLVTVLHGVSDGDAARQLSLITLTERLSRGRLESLETLARGKKSREALEIMAAPSAFLDPPALAISPDPPPAMATQQQILASAAAYLDQTIPRLPNFFATRTTVEYGEIPGFDGGENRIDPVPLHVIQHSRNTVLYRHGAEIVDARPHRRQSKFGSIQAYGTFGPLLTSVRETLKHPEAFVWRGWEQFAGIRAAVFRYEVPASQSRFMIEGCCLPQGNGSQLYATMPGYQGEMVIDPASGALLRITLITDLRYFLPENRAAMMVSYGPVTIGDRTYILPLRSVSLLRARSVQQPQEWEQDFRTWGPYLTMLTDFSFTDYHMFRGSARILPGVTRETDGGQPRH